MLNLPESILALFASPTRAAAMMGDLTEMARTRGRGWFVAAYTRTLLALTWRIVLALFVADIGRQLIFDLFHLYIGHTPAAWRNATGSWLDLLNSSGPLLACIMSTLWFALPFAAVRYGVRDRFVQLTFAIAVGTTVAFLAIPFASLLVASATLALAAAAFLSPRLAQAAGSPALDRRRRRARHRRSQRPSLQIPPTPLRSRSWPACGQCLCAALPNRPAGSRLRLLPPAHSPAGSLTHRPHARLTPSSLDCRAALRYYFT